MVLTAASVVEALKPAIREAGAILLRHRANPSGIQHKSDDTLVSDADRASSAYLQEQIHLLFPEAAILDEEADHLAFQQKEYTFVIDPLDGTREYLAGQKNFSIMIGLLEAHQPVLGISYRPVLHELCWAYLRGGAHREIAGKQQSLRVSPDAQITLLTSSSRSDDVFERWTRGLLPHSVQRMAGSCKILEVAQGHATAFVCPPKQTMHVWDLCAFSVILYEAGGIITDFSGKPLDFSLKTLAYDQGFIVSNGIVHSTLVRAAERYGIV